MKLVIGNKAYSSWSLRPWIAMKQLGLAFEEIVIPMAQPGTKAEMLKYSPNGLVPALIDGDITVFETIAILEHLNERHAGGTLWPKDPVARAHARSVAAEMHGGFAAFRRDCPFNIRRAVKRHVPSADGTKAAERIDAIWQECRARFGQSTEGGVARSCSESSRLRMRCMRRLSTASTSTTCHDRRHPRPIWRPSWRSRPGRNGRRLPGPNLG